MKTNKKLPPYGSILAERQKYLNLPDLVFICTGKDGWNSAKRRNARGDNCAMVLPPDLNPESCIWPVARCQCVVEWSSGPDVKLIINLVRVLLLSGADLVVVWPTFVDHKSPIVNYDETRAPGERWVQCREAIRVYRGSNNSTGGAHAAA